MPRKCSVEKVQDRKLTFAKLCVYVYVRVFFLLRGVSILTSLLFLFGGGGGGRGVSILTQHGVCVCVCVCWVLRVLFSVEFKGRPRKKALHVSVRSSFFF